MLTEVFLLEYNVRNVAAKSIRKAIIMSHIMSLPVPIILFIYVVYKYKF